MRIRVRRNLICSPTLTSHSKMPKHSNQNRRNETRDRPFDNTPPAKFTH